MGIFQHLKPKKSRREPSAAEPVSQPIPQPASPRDPEPAPESQPKRRFPSYLMVIPRDWKEIEDGDAMLHRLSAALEADPTVELQQLSRNDEGLPHLLLAYQGNTYQADLFPESFQRRESDLPRHPLPEEDLRQLQNTLGVTVQLFFQENAQEGLHLQFKIADALVSDALAVVDSSRQRILSPEWLHLAAASAVPPAKEELFALQTTPGDDGSAWVHSHGLYRCGYPEVEALCVPKDHVPLVETLLSSMAATVLDTGGFPPEEQPFCLAQFSPDDPLLVSWQRWERCAQAYPAGAPGVGETRDKAHQGPAAVLSYYDSQADAEAGRRRPLGELDPARCEHLLYRVIPEETARVQALALERLDSLRRGLALPDAHALVEAEADTDVLILALTSLGDDSLTGNLIPQPGLPASFHPGEEVTLPLAHLKNWVLFCRQQKISPDDVYLLQDLPD